MTKQQLQELFLTSKDGCGSTGNADLDYALYNFFQSDNGIQSPQEAVLIANDYMLPKYHTVDGDVQLKFLRDIFYSLLPYCEKNEDYKAAQQIHTKLLQTLNK
jgi:hypothetical protein